MREPERVERMTVLLNEIWGLVPDWRLTQLIMNAANLDESFPKLFYMEDTDMESKLEKLLEDLRKTRKQT